MRKVFLRLEFQLNLHVVFFVASRHRIAIVVANVSNSLSKGLNFSVHGDAAWGAYFCSMMRDEHRDAKMVATGFVPEMYLLSLIHI